MKSQNYLKSIPSSIIFCSYSVLRTWKCWTCIVVYSYYCTTSATVENLLGKKISISNFLESYLETKHLLITNPFVADVGRQRNNESEWVRVQWWYFNRWAVSKQVPPQAPWFLIHIIHGCYLALSTLSLLCFCMCMCVRLYFVCVCICVCVCVCGVSRQSQRLWTYSESI